MEQSLKKIENSPLVSVIIPAYNAENFIERTLESVRLQTYKNIEILVIDDGSQDRTDEIVKSVAQQESRLILLQQANTGVAAARNLAIQKAKGEFIAPIDADDIWYPQNLEKQIQCFMQSDVSVGLVYAWSVDIDEQDSLTGGFHVSDEEGEVYAKLLYQNFIGNASSTVIRRTCLEKVGGYNWELKSQGAQGSEDFDLYLRIAECYQVRVVPEFLIGYRQIASSMSQNYASMAKSHDLVLEKASKKYPEIPAAIYRWSSSNVYVHLAYKIIKSGKPSEALSWLYKAFQLDFTMMLVRPDLYLLIILIIFKFIQLIFVTQVNYNPGIRSKKTANNSRNINNSRIKWLITIRKYLLSKIYDRFRFKWICQNQKKWLIKSSQSAKTTNAKHLIEVGDQ
jgi:glycosyltransferase involved in cell wall biosynthesis